MSAQVCRMTRDPSATSELPPMQTPPTPVALESTVKASTMQEVEELQVNRANDPQEFVAVRGVDAGDPAVGLHLGDRDRHGAAHASWPAEVEAEKCFVPIRGFIVELRSVLQGLRVRPLGFVECEVLSVGQLPLEDLD